MTRRTVRRGSLVRICASVLGVALLGACLGPAPQPPPADPPSAATPAATSGSQPSLAFDPARVQDDQQRLLAAALADVAPGEPGRTDLFFIGFAGFAAEDVFLHEAQAARAVLDRRFGTAGRSMLLVNNPETVAALPLASIGNLAAALAGVGKRMNRDEDVLFLFLTSHGDEGGWLSTRFDPFRPRAFVARQLDQALDDAGIKWRVVVISACFSGAFIEPLADPSSLIITAARDDRTSFGCGHDGQFTFFGRAYFGDALPATGSFLRAFDAAKARVAEWERERNFAPSLPQIHVGGAIEAKLSEIEGRAQGSAAE